MQRSCKLHHSILFLSFMVTLSGTIFLVQFLNKKYGSNVVLLLMNSFNTQKTLKSKFSVHKLTES